MITLGEIARRYGDTYRAAQHNQLLPSHDAALRAIASCRTPALGGHVYSCATCGIVRYSYHSCRNRHCPTCQHDAAQAWLNAQQELLLGVPYYLVTFTLPSELRPLARSQQRQIYSLFFRASAAALQQLAADPRFVGGRIGMLGVLQTWTRDLRYHPHIHYLVPAIGLGPDGRWVRPASPKLLVHVVPLAQLVRAKMQAALRQLPSAANIPPAVWSQRWVVDCRQVASGAAALKYLAPYVFRVALSNNRIVRLTEERLTFRYIDGATHQPKLCTLPVLTFLHRFLQHVLPRGFVKVRSFGLFRPRYRKLLAQLKAELALAAGRVPQATREEQRPSARDPPATLGRAVERCPNCGQLLQATPLAPVWGRAPP
jgi:hypothetical protein